MRLGKIVKSTSHADYICQIYAPGDVENLPKVQDYAFGSFVRIALDTEQLSWLVGLIYDTVLLNPDFGRLGPRLSPPSELAVFSPDYLNEKVTVVGVIAIGMIDESGKVFQGVPPFAANSDAVVETLTDEQIRLFHRGNPSWKISYLPYLLAKNTPEARYLLQNVLGQLRTLCNDIDQARVINLMADEISWQTQIAPLGGLS
ncbi:MAG: hypothetical protein CVU44_12960 [Chloroflexi bacterium HGW-Chloroflexi-6]|nr:MAG: hypothetical protein CVU44_12960 [Chloroflexi bacterium HGW-Chloroflexi-6]